MTFIIAVAACSVLIIAAITGLAMYALSGEQPAGRHTRRQAPAAVPQDQADPFAGPDDGQDPDEAADEYIAALNEPEPETRPEPVLAAPVTAPLEPLPPSPPARREHAVIPDGGLQGWEPPVSRGTLESLRDALRAWNPAAGAPEPEPAPEPPAQSAGADTQEIFLNLVGGIWDPAAMTAEIEASVYGDTAEDGSEEKADFAGVSLAGLPDDGWDLSAPVALTGKHHLNGDLA
jgi:hypothetical protein